MAVERSRQTKAGADKKLPKNAIAFEMSESQLCSQGKLGILFFLNKVGTLWEIKSPFRLLLDI